MSRLSRRTYRLLLLYVTNHMDAGFRYFAFYIQISSPNVSLGLSAREGNSGIDVSSARKVMIGLLGKYGDRVVSTYAPGANEPANMSLELALFASTIPQCRCTIYGLCKCDHASARYVSSRLRLLTVDVQ